MMYSPPPGLTKSSQNNWSPSVPMFSRAAPTTSVMLQDNYSKILKLLGGKNKPGTVCKYVKRTGSLQPRCGYLEVVGMSVR